MNDISARQLLARAHHGLKMLLGRGRVKLTNESDFSVQVVQMVVSAKETMDMPRLAEFGLSSWIPKDGDVAVIFLNADRTNGIVIASGHQKFRFKLENEGEMAIWDAFGKSIWFKKDAGGIVVEAANQPVLIDHAKKVTVNAGTDGAEVNTTGDVILNMGGKNLVVNNPGAVHLDGAPGRKVVCDGDPVSGGVVHAAAGQKVTAT